MSSESHSCFFDHQCQRQWSWSTQYWTKHWPKWKAPNDFTLRWAPWDSVLSSREGIHITSEVRNNGETVHLSITTLDGRVIFSVERPSYSTALWSFAGSEFLLVNETRRQPVSYYVPPQYSDPLKNALHRKKRLRPSLLDHLDHDGVNDTGRNKFEEFLMRPELSLLEEAAEALGRSGIQGRESQPTMIFYTAALRFSKMMREYNEDDDDSDSSGAEIMDDPFPIPTNRRPKRWYSYCSNNGRYCLIRCPIGNSCLGLCGPGCDCWWWVCGHCCFSPGCYDHDRICSIQDQHFSPECILTAPLGLACIPFFYWRFFSNQLVAINYWLYLMWYLFCCGVCMCT